MNRDTFYHLLSTESSAVHSYHQAGDRTKIYPYGGHLGEPLVLAETTRYSTFLNL